jgi:hypothetical protein
MSSLEDYELRLSVSEPQKEVGFKSFKTGYLTDIIRGGTQVVIDGQSIYKSNIVWADSEIEGSIRVSNVVAATGCCFRGSCLSVIKNVEIYVNNEQIVNSGVELGLARDLLSLVSTANEDVSELKQIQLEKITMPNHSYTGPSDVAIVTADVTTLTADTYVPAMATKIKKSRQFFDGTYTWLPYCFPLSKLHSFFDQPWAHQPLSGMNIKIVINLNDEVNNKVLYYGGGLTSAPTWQNGAITPLAPTVATTLQYQSNTRLKYKSLDLSTLSREEKLLAEHLSKPREFKGFYLEHEFKSLENSSSVSVSDIINSNAQNPDKLMVVGVPHGSQTTITDFQQFPIKFSQFTVNVDGQPFNNTPFDQNALWDETKLSMKKLTNRDKIPQSMLSRDDYDSLLSLNCFDLSKIQKQSGAGEKASPIDIVASRCEASSADLWSVLWKRVYYKITNDGTNTSVVRSGISF